MNIHKVFGKEAPTDGGEAVTVSESSNATGIESNADEVKGQKGIKSGLLSQIFFITELIMQDERGHYYYPNPNDKKARVYVRKQNDVIEFRMWQQDHPEVWEKHEWIPMEIIENAARMYREMGRETNPMLLYDEAIARTLLKDVL